MKILIFFTEKASSCHLWILWPITSRLCCSIQLCAGQSSCSHRWGKSSQAAKCRRQWQWAWYPQRFLQIWQRDLWWWWWRHWVQVKTWRQSDAEVYWNSTCHRQSHGRFHFLLIFLVSMCFILKFLNAHPVKRWKDIKHCKKQTQQSVASLFFNIVLRFNRHICMKLAKIAF